MIFPPQCNFLDIFFKLISNTIYKCILFIIFLFVLLATKKTKFFQDIISCSRWWWFNFRSSHTKNRFLLWWFTFNLNENTLRQSIEMAVTTNMKATFCINQTWKSLYFIPSCFLVFRVSEYFKSDYSLNNVIHSLLSFRP